MLSGKTARKTANHADTLPLHVDQCACVFHVTGTHKLACRDTCSIRTAELLAPAVPPQMSRRPSRIVVTPMTNVLQSCLNQPQTVARHTASLASTLVYARTRPHALICAPCTYARPLLLAVCTGTRVAGRPCITITPITTLLQACVSQPQVVAA